MMTYDGDGGDVMAVGMVIDGFFLFFSDLLQAVNRRGSLTLSLTPLLQAEGMLIMVMIKKTKKKNLLFCF